MKNSALGLGALPAASRISRWVRRLLRLAAGGALVAAVLAPVALVLVPVLLLASAYTERTVFRFSADATRQAFFDSEAAKASARLFRRGSGVPSRDRHLRATERSPSPRAAMPSMAVTTTVAVTRHQVVAPNRTRVSTPLAVRRSTAQQLSWTGERLEVTDRRGRVTAWAVTVGGATSDFFPAVMKSRYTDRAAPPTDDARVAALAAVGTRRLPIEAVVLLDKHSRRLGTVPASGFAEADLAAVAEHAGIEYSVIQLPARFRHPVDTLAGALFPRSVRYRRIAGVPREWGPLTPVRNVAVAVFTGVAETTTSG